MNLQRLSIHQTYGQIGIQTNNASAEIESPQGDLKIEQHPAEMNFHSEPGKLEIDSSAAWAALGKGGHMAWMNSIYSQLPGVFRQALAKIAEDGNRAAQITNKSNAFAEIAKGEAFSTSGIQYVGPAGLNNVKIHYEPQQIETNIEPVKPTIQYTPVKPQVTFVPGSVDIYMKQMNSIDIQVSSYDWYK
ncbi:DUF6470 family protein [Paenibacillus rigui]|uniref:Uncharacterized protein n=1 Tax=Paenibacillus rigui TaxID=554312 RepID=A0A229USQ1_9BACL|nr:DUF6470 family protein [Paenibacillus rigui]OXM86363.1 hypothetical protein CF651_10545 [Paenibacillus rigui]